MCAVNGEFLLEMSEDSAVYAKHYQMVRTEVLESLKGLTDGFRNTDIVHAFLHLDGKSEFLVGGKRRVVAQFVEACEAAGVKLLVLASSTPAEAYYSLRGRRHRLNLILTLDRSGALFPGFLDSLLGELAGGNPFLAAWSKVARADGPSCYGSAALPTAMFLR